MPAIELPELQRRRAKLAVVVDVAEVSDTPLFSVTTWRGAGHPPRRQWFADRSIALAHAAERADELAVPMVDLTGEPGE
ncbi:MAG: hypothetical protein AB7E24_14710 [Novosphingobium sp.]